MLYLDLDESYRDHPVAAVTRIKRAIRAFDEERSLPEWERGDFENLCGYLLSEIDDILESFFDKRRFPEDFEDYE